MAKGIHDLGNTRGYIYTTAVDGTTILNSIINSQQNARNIKVEGRKASSNALRQKPFATIQVATVTGVGSITGITVNGYAQISTAIAYTGATSVSALATLIASGINGFDEGIGNDYRASAIGDTVYIIGEEGIGDADNGVTPIVTTTGNSTYTYTDVNGGSDATELYQQAYGYRFFLDADYDTSGCSGGGTATQDSLSNAVEITNYIVPRDLNSAIPLESGTISSGGLTVTRTSAITSILIDTEGAAATDDLDTILTTGFAEADIIICRGAATGRVVTFKHGTGNISLQNATDFSSGNPSNTLTLQLINSVWREVSRSTQQIGDTAAYRTAGFGFFGIDEFNTAAIAASGTTTFTGGTSDKFQELTGSQTLSGNTTYDLAAGAVNGDSFVLRYDASVDLNGFTLDIFNISLTSDMALNGGLMFFAQYKEGAWYTWATINMDRGGVTYPFVLATEMYKDDSITVAKVESNIEHQWKYLNVSFETGEIGDMKITMPKCTVVSFSASVLKAIAGTDDATIVPKNNAGTAMTAGTVTIPLSSAIGTQATSTPTANNTFTEGQTMTLTTAKATAGGKAIVSFRIQLT